MLEIESSLCTTGQSQPYLVHLWRKKTWIVGTCYDKTKVFMFWDNDCWGKMVSWAG